MRTLLWVLLCGDFIFLLMIGSMKLGQYNMTDFAFKERAKSLSSDNAKRWRRFHKLFPAVTLLQQVELITAGVVFVAIMSALYDWPAVVVGTLVAFVLLKILSRQRYILEVATKLFESTLDIVIKTTEVLHPLWWVLGTAPHDNSSRPESASELADQVSKFPSSVLDSTQKKRLQAVLESQTKIVKSVMTAKQSITSVKPHSTLGPVLLSDLQKTGHGYFPVYEKNAEPEGILDISALSDIQSAKQRQTVRDIMNSQTIWVEEETSLEELVQAFLQEKQYMLFVRNLNGDFTGIVTIADLLKQLIGVVKD